MTEFNAVASITDAIDTPPPPSLRAPQSPTATPVSALGGRSTQVPANLNLELLRQASVAPNLVPNTSNSTGVSSVLKELLMESGYVFQVVREIYNDSSATGTHRSGNAIDVSSSEVRSIVRFLRQFPSLFTEVTYLDSTYGGESLLIVNGAIVSSTRASAGVGQIHIASSSKVLFKALNTRSVRAVMGVAATQQFGQRLVYSPPVASIIHPDADEAGSDFW